jgi:hypothetical protein
MINIYYLIKDKGSIRWIEFLLRIIQGTTLSGIEIVLNMAEMVITGHRSMIQSLNHYLILLIWYMYITILQFQKKKIKNF